jgi:hypothetical protein
VQSAVGTGATCVHQSKSIPAYADGNMNTQLGRYFAGYTSISMDMQLVRLGFGSNSLSMLEA